MSYYKSILTFLKKEKYLALPGIGAWSIRTIPARILDNNELIPASTLLEFEKDFLGDQYQKQISHLSKAWSCSDIESRQVLLKLGSKILDSSAKHERYLLPGIGYVLFKENKVEFESTGDLERSFNYFNSKVQLHKAFKLKPKSEDVSSVVPVLNIDTQELEQKIETLPEKTIVSEEIEPKFRSLSWFKYVAAVLLFAFIGFSGWNLVTNTDQYLLPVKYDLDSSGYDIEAFNRSPETDGTDMNIDKVLEEDKLGMEIEDSSLVKEDVVIPTKEIIDESEIANCVLIMGTFGNSRNVDRMVRKIENLGFSVYQESIEGNTRIGAIVICNDQLSISQLKNIEPQAWILDQ